MHRRGFGPNGPLVPVIGQGTWKMEGASRAQAVRALQRGLDLGLTHIDTAEMYGSGSCEEIVADAVAGRRDQAFIVSKVLPQNASRKGTLRACDDSLARLRVDHLDAYLLHWRGSHPLAETVAAFEELLAAGKTRAWGVSNFDVEDLEELRAVAPRLPVCNQVLYHLQERAIEHAVLPWCAQYAVTVVAYTPFGTGRFPDDSCAEGEVLAQVARLHEATPRQVALAFLTRASNTLTIPKAVDLEHVAENAGAGDLQLTPENIAQIDAAFPRGRPRRGLPTA